MSDWCLKPPGIRLPGSLVDSLGARSETLKKMTDAFNDQHRSTLSNAASQTQIVPAGSPARPNRPDPPRTQSRPIFTPPDAPPNVTQTITGKSEMSIVEFQNKYEQLRRRFFRVAHL